MLEHWQAPVGVCSHIDTKGSVFLVVGTREHYGDIVTVHLRHDSFQGGSTAHSTQSQWHMA